MRWPPALDAVASFCQWPVVQLVERLTLDQEVVGSRPARPATRSTVGSVIDVGDEHPGCPGHQATVVYQCVLVGAGGGGVLENAREKGHDSPQLAATGSRLRILGGTSLSSSG